MTSTSKFDLSSGSPDRVTYPGGQRGGCASLSFSASHREGVDNRIPPALASTPRSTTTLSFGDVLNYFHGLSPDSKQLAVGHKLPRQVDLSRDMIANLGISSGYTKLLPASSLEELKRVKANLHDNSVRARDRSKTLDELTSKFDKCFPNIPKWKPSRSDVPTFNRVNSSTSNDRNVFGGVSKMGTQSQTSAFDTEAPKLEEKTKSVVPNKRTRTSLLDVQMDSRGNVLAKPHGSMERDKEFLGLANAVQSEEKDQMVSNGVDGWEKSRMKKKRSGIKSGISTSTGLNRPLDGDHESKRDMHQRLGSDDRSRSRSALGFRSGPSNGSAGLGKLDVTSQKAGPGTRTTPKNDQDTGSHLNDKKENLVGLEKEHINIKSFNRSNIRENSNATSSASMKIKTVIRAPRSGAGAVPKASPKGHRSIGGSDDWELSQSTNKLHAVTAANNRKRTTSARSSSPPVAQGTGQRPQKIPRVARRSNFVPLMLGHEETPALDTESNISGSDSGVGFQVRSPGNALQAVKVKGDQFSSPALSESEESGAAEIKSKDKSRNSTEMDGKGGQSLLKDGKQVLPSRKNRMLNAELGLGGSVRRQGRTVRGFASTRSSNVVSVGKSDNAVTAKQLRSSRVSSDKIESKTGRPPTKKLSDRRVYTRPRHSVNAGVPDFHGESVDGNEELLAAANAAMNSGHACSGKFWRHMEPIFGLVSSEDIAYLKKQANCSSGPSPLHDASGDDFTISSGFGPVKYEGDKLFTNEAKSADHLSKQFVPGEQPCSVPSLFQRVLSAFIVEGDDGFCDGGQQDFEFDGFGNMFELDEELKYNSWNQRSLDDIQTVKGPASNGYRMTATGRYLDDVEDDESECADITIDTNAETVANYEHSVNGCQPDQMQSTGIACTQSQYNQMSIPEKLLLELQSIGIFPESVSEDDKISEDIRKLEEKLHKQALKKKQFLCNLEMSVTDARKSQERDVERRAFDELVRMAYEKYMTCWGPNASCGRGMTGKIAKQAALAFVGRTIERCHKFENSGESCFNEAAFLDVFNSVPSLINAESMHKEGESSILYAETPIHSSEVTIPASAGSHPILSPMSQSAQNLDSQGRLPFDNFESVNHLHGQTTAKDDAASNKMKRRELLLDDIGGTVGTSVGTPSGIGSSLLSGAKGKRSERDREGKGHGREMHCRNTTAKIGRPSIGITKGERKSKAKPKQRTTQLSASVNCLLGKTSNTPKGVTEPLQESFEATPKGNSTKYDNLSKDILPEHEVFDLSHLQLPEMDALGVPDDLGVQGQYFNSLFDFDEDGSPDDYNYNGGLDIPMDDLSECIF